MANSIDFRADQIQTKQIIVTGSGAGTTKLLIYGIEAQGSPVNEGEIDINVFPQDGIGGDVFLYVSGAVNAKGSVTVRGTSVFGGDLVVSGSLYNGAVTAAGGNYSHAEGAITTASGQGSHAEGYGTLASGPSSHAEGESTTASGQVSHAEGVSTNASGKYSHAEGQTTIAYGEGSHAEGYHTNASGDYCHAEGQDTYVTTLGDYSHAEGHFTKVDNRYAHAEGYGTLTSALYSHAEGYLTTGSGQASHAEGQNTTAGGGYSHAEGQNTSTLGTHSHAEGYQTQTTGAYSHAQGSGSITWGIYSFAAGNRTIASGSVDVTQAAFGRFNKRNNETSLFVVGNGTGDSDALRKDIFRAESTGELVLSGGIRHSFRKPTTSEFITLTRSDYMVVVDTLTIAANAVVYLPVITDAVADIGLTVIINHYASSIGTDTVGIEPGNAGYEISGFNSTWTTGAGRFVLNTLGGTVAASNRRSVTLTFVGLRGGDNTWAIMQHSIC